MQKTMAPKRKPKLRKSQRIKEKSGQNCQILNNDGVICLSGILTNQENDIHKTYSKEFTFVDISEKDGWISIIGQKKSM